MNKRTFGQRMTDFFNGKGFYIALAFCLFSIVASCWYLWQEFSLAKDMAAQVSSAQPVTVAPDPAETQQEAQATVTETDPADADGYEEDEDATADSSIEAAENSAETWAEETVTESAPAEHISEEVLEPVEELEVAEELNAEDAEWLFPVEGQVVAAFSADVLQYNAALGDWRTHSGLDLSAELGSEVIAACSGTVTGVDTDLLLGRTVTIDCGSGIITRYSNLAEEVTVTAGDHVATGERLGTVGETAVGERNSGAWLHFSVTKDGAQVDPADYLNR